MAKLKEQIKYGDRPERMDPRLELKLGSPENLYAKNPAMRKGVEDVQRLVSSRFGKVADKLKQVTGIEDISSQQVQGMIYQEMMSKVPAITRIEGRNREELEQLAIDASLEETQVPADWFEIEASLNRAPINTSDFRMKMSKPEKKDDDSKLPEIPSFDVEDLTEDELMELEIHKRNMINAIIQGAAKKGHYIFQKPEVKERLDAIDPQLYPAYLGIMAINDFMYFSMEQMIEMMSRTGSGVAGKVKVENKDEDEEEEGGEDRPDTKIVAEGLIFPILCHEIIKGLEESIARHGLPEDSEMSRNVRGVTDVLSNEPMQLRIGPEIVEKIRFALPDEMFDEENKGLVPWFYSNLYQTPAQEFLEIIGNAISEDESKVKKATAKFKEIMRKAQQQKSEYDESKGTDSSEDEDDDYDQLYRDLGIPRP